MQSFAANPEPGANAADAQLEHASFPAHVHNALRDESRNLGREIGRRVSLPSADSEAGGDLAAEFGGYLANRNDLRTQARLALSAEAAAAETAEFSRSALQHIYTFGFAIGTLRHAVASDPSKQIALQKAEGELADYINRLSNEVLSGQDISRDLQRFGDMGAQHGLESAISAERGVLDIFSGSHFFVKEPDRVFNALRGLSSRERLLLDDRYALRDNEVRALEIQSRTFLSLPLRLLGGGVRWALEHLPGARGGPAELPAPTPLGRAIVHSFAGSLNSAPQLRQKALCMLAGDITGAAVETLQMALEPRILIRDKRRLELLKEAYESVPKSDHPQLEARFLSRYGASYDAPGSVRQVFENRMSGATLELASALRQGDEALACAVKLRDLFSSPALGREQKLCALLDENNAAIARAAEIYAEFGGGTLRGVIEERVREPHFRNWALALIENNADAAVWKSAAAIAERNPRWLAEIFYGSSPEFIGAHKQRFSELTGKEFTAELERSFKNKATRLALLRDLTTRGELSKAHLIEECTRGLGTDEEALRKLTATLTRSEARALRAEFRRTFGEDIKQRLFGGFSELAGDQMHVIRHQLSGGPEKPEQIRHRLLRNFQYEGFLGGLWEKVGLPIRTLVSPMTRDFRVLRLLMNKQMEEAEQFYQSNIHNKSPSPEQEQRYRILARQAKLTCEAFRRAKNFVGENFARVTADVAALGVAVFAPYLGAGKALAWCGAALITTFGRLLVETAFKGGQTYTHERGLLYLIRAVGDIASWTTGGILRLGRDTFARYARSIAKNVFRQFEYFYDYFRRIAPLTRFVVEQQEKSKPARADVLEAEQKRLVALMSAAYQPRFARKQPASAPIK